MPLLLRPALRSDDQLLYRLLREALGPYVTMLWSWDEGFQQERWERVFDPLRWQVIGDGNVEVGGLELEHRPDELYLANLLVFPEHQRRGIGTGVIQRLLSAAHEEATPVRLQVLKVNPARALYARLGFVEQGETETHCLMLASPPAYVSREPVGIRKAMLTDVPSINALIAVSARTLGSGDYAAEQIEAALLGAWGVDSEIIRDETCFVAEVENELVLCGGWSRRATLFGGDTYERREARSLDPERESARIRAFFVHPHWARRGLGSRLLALCEAEARAAGFLAAELVATLSGERFYARHGYVSTGRRSYPLPGGISIDFVSMRRTF